MIGLKKIVSKLSGQNQRTALIRKNIFASFFIKAWMGVVQLLMVPLTLHCLGVYENGIWLTISSMLIWVDNLDIGLGNGLRNKLAEYLAVGNREKARQAVSSTFFMLLALFVPFTIFVNLWIWTADTYAFFNVDPAVVGNFNTVLCVAAVLVCSTFVFKFIGNFYMALQMPAVNNLLIAAGQTLSLAGTLAVYLSGSRSLLLIALVNTLSPFLVYLASYPITFFRKYAFLRPSIRCVDVRSMIDLASMGVKFFVLQVSGIILFMTTNIIISRFFSPEMVTPYQIAYRYFSLLLLFFSIICVPYWSATTDAYKRGDFDWIRRAGRTLNRVTAGIVLLALVLVLISRPIYKVWIGDAEAVPLGITVGVALYILTLVVSTRYSYILNGFGALRLQLIMTVTAAVVYIPLAVLVCRWSPRMESLLVVMCAVNLPGLVVNVVQYRKILRRTASGIWLR